ncbi:MAG: 4-hydroxy-tetrahydrodipicolinate synthase [Elusimicrobiota bacterium]
MSMNFTGCYTALVTPFKKNLSLDEDSLRRLIRFQIKSKVTGLVPCGSTGEAHSLNPEEWRRVIEITAQEGAGRLPVIAGISANATAKAVELCRLARNAGATAVLSVCPYYNKPTQEGLFRHFDAIAQSADLDIMIYNIPGRTAVNLLPKTLLRLAHAHSNISAIKEASGDIEQAGEIILSAPKAFQTLSGDDGLTLPMMALGASGVVSVASNVAPAQVSELCRNMSAGKLEKARQAHRTLAPLVNALFLETNPIPVKAALEMMGICRSETRLPLTPLSPNLRPILKNALKSAGVI